MSPISDKHYGQLFLYMGTFLSSWSTPLLLKKGRGAAALLVLLEKLDFVILARVVGMVGGICAQMRVHCRLSIFVSQPTWLNQAM